MVGLVIAFGAGVILGALIAWISFAMLTVAGREVESGLEVTEVRPQIRPVKDGLVPEGELIEEWFERIEAKGRETN